MPKTQIDLTADEIDLILDWAATAEEYDGQLTGEEGALVVKLKKAKLAAE